MEQDKDQFLRSQPDLIKKLEEKFGEEIMKLKTSDTPAGPGTHVMQPTSNEENWNMKCRRNIDLELDCYSIYQNTQDQTCQTAWEN